MNNVEVFEDYGEDCPFPFFSEPSKEGYYKIYHDGGHYVATRVWRKAPSERKECESKPVKQFSEDKSDVKFNRIMRKKRMLLHSGKDRKIAFGLGLGVVRCSRSDMDILFDSLYYQAYTQGLRDKKDDKPMTDYIRDGILKLFPATDDLDEWIAKKIKCKFNNLCHRKKRFRRKANLNCWNYFVTFTYDDAKHTAESFRKKLRKCLSNLHTRRGWKYMGVFEYSPEKGRLHFHGLLYVPDGEMIGTITEKTDYSTVTHEMQTRHENSFFEENFGRNDFCEVSKEEMKNGRRTEYIIKYIGKTNERICYSRGIPTEIYRKIDGDDIVVEMQDFVTKYILFDDTIDWERDIMHYNRKKQMSIIDLLCNPPRIAV